MRVMTFIPGVPENRVRYAPRANVTSLLVGLVDGEVALLRADTGKVIWSQRPGGEITGLEHGGDIIYLALSSGRRLDVRPIRQATSDQPSLDVRDENGDPIYERNPSNAYEYRIRYERVETLFDLAHIEARRASDGNLLWRFTNTRFPIRANMQLAGETLVVSSSPLLQGAYDMWGLDARTGVIRWRRSYPSVPSTRKIVAPDHSVEAPSERFSLVRTMAGQDNRLYVDLLAYPEPPNSNLPEQVQRRLEALDTATGSTIWRQDINLETQRLEFSTDGALIARTTHAKDTNTVTAHTKIDGAPVGTSDYPGKFTFHVMSHDGTAYLLEDDAGVARLHTAPSSGAAPDTLGAAPELGAPDVILTFRMFHPEGSLREQHAEVVALDAVSGAVRWRWESPKNIEELLRIWGLRAPEAFAASALRQARKAGPRFWDWLPGEIENGQLRKPAELSIMRLDLVGDTVYVSGRLGVFALRAQDGALRWAGLANREVSIHLPLAFPQS